ncbi:integrin alpha-4-like isoform X2 [Bacillus rossius redtenbacheri]|uniref:integrin alpha-4-like isoform X2 n=1 Tax=Bacillus rossius redtenbacheri TaxID=93214 RepID=UPI002FDCCADD
MWTTAWCALLAALRMRAAGFNLDSDHADVLAGAAGSYFGYSVALRGVGRADASLVVGAPRANSSFPKDARFVEPGAVYECRKNGPKWLCGDLDLGPKRLSSNVAQYKYKLRKEHAGYGAAIDTQPTSNSPLVVCGPGIKNEFLYQTYYTNGICFVSTKGAEEPAVKLPLSIFPKQTNSNGNPNYAYGEAGMSVHFTKNATELLIGAPGVQVWTGTVIKYNMDEPGSVALIPDPAKIEGLGYYDYFGFSVCSGKFYSSQTLYVSGAPRAALLKGKVLVFGLTEEPWQPLQTHEQLEGRQMGEYFGSVLCVLDLNADGFDDLVVGAPRHSARGSLAGDHGRIYVYLGSPHGKLQDMNDTVITGSSCPSANFGTAMASIGDINMDGYQDLAVGAPYEDKGAIYIYHGCKNGMKPNYAQRILASDVASHIPLAGFGFSISSGLDIDGNHYNDIAVGAYSSAQAVVLRSRPVVHLHGTLSADVAMISLDDLAFSFTACVNFTGQFLPPQLGITASLKVDSDLNRVSVHGQENGLSFNTTVSRQAQDCKRYTVKIKTGVDDFASPVKVSLDLSLQDTIVVAGSNLKGDFCQSCPVVDPGSNGTVMSVLFDNGCGSDAVCQTDLAVHVQFVNITEPFILDPEKPFSVAVSVANSKEPAYQSWFTLETSGDVSLVKIPSSCQQLPDTLTLRLECTLGHKPLTNVSQPVAVVLELGLSKVAAGSGVIVFNVTAGSSGDEQTPLNNTALLNLKLFLDTEPILIGRSKPTTLYFSQQSDDMMLAHVYEVRSGGPSPMAEVDLEILVPTMAVIGEKSVSVVSVDVVLGQLGARQLNCTWRQSSVMSTVSEGSRSTNTTLLLSCEQQPVSCVAVTCHGVGPFPTTRTAAVVSVHMRALPTPLYAVLGQKKYIELSSLGRAIYTLPENSIERNRSSEPGMLVAVTGATSVLIADVAAEKVEPWILLLAILAGLLILLLIALGMYKAGFFRRKRSDYSELHEGTVLNTVDEMGSESPGESTRLPHK